jgi:DNA-binding response OmpR family regulator
MARRGNGIARRGVRYAGASGSGFAMAPLHRPTVLLIDPDLEAAARLANVRYTVKAVRSAAEARTWLATERPALIVMELELPDADGLVMCAELRSRTTAALLVHTVRDAQRDLILSLRLGADDFVPKPGDEAEIEARIGALLRRMTRGAALGAAGSAGREWDAGRGAQRLGDLVVDRERSIATIEGRPLHLTQTEFRLLSAFARRVGEPLRREELAQWAGEWSYVAGTRSLDMHVRRLRAKLRYVRDDPKLATARLPSIVPVRGTGYRMTAPEADREALSRARQTPDRRIAPPAA